MSTQSKDEVSQMLMDWRNGDRTALDRLIPLMHQELRRLARNYLRGARTDHPPTTALVKRGLLRLINYRNKKMRIQEPV